MVLCFSVNFKFKELFGWWKCYISTGTVVHCVMWESETLLQFPCHITDRLPEFWLEWWVYFVICFNLEAILWDLFQITNFIYFFLHILEKNYLFFPKVLSTYFICLYYYDNTFKNYFKQPLEFTSFLLILLILVDNAWLMPI